MSDPDEECRQHGCDSIAEYRCLQHRHLKRYPVPGDLSSDTVSLPLNSHIHTHSADAAEVDTEKIGISAREDASYSEPLYARLGIQSPEPLSVMVNLPVKRDTKPTTGLHHSVRATYTPERKLVPVTFPEILEVRDVTRPTSLLVLFDQGAEADQRFLRIYCWKNQNRIHYLLICLN